MRKMICLLLLPFFACTVAQARKPEWAEKFDPYATYPKDTYLVGFGTSAGGDSEAFELAQDNARANVSRIIVVDVKGELLSVKEETREKYSQHVSSITQSSTAIQLMGLKTETYGDESPPTAYALAYVSKKALQDIYSERKSTLCKQINRIIEDARVAERDSSKMEAATKYLSLYPLYERLKEAEAILMVVGHSAGIEKAFAELSSAAGEAPMITWTEVSNKVDELLLQSPENVDDVARSVVIQLSKQAGVSGQLLIVPFTYRDTKMTGSFARYFRSALENQLGRMANLNWNAVSETKGFKPKSSQIMSDLAEASGAQWLLSGTYWEQGEKIKLMATLRNVDDGKILAGADVLFDASILEPAGLSPKPENFEQALIEQNAFTENEIISGQVQVDVWTNKGNQNLLFTEAETMKVYVRVNRPAYIRLLYILADGRRTLLYDNHYIDQSKVNHVVEIPEEFECAPPFGAEMMFVVARTEMFEPLKTVEVDGYHYLEADAPREAAAQARGMKRKKTEEVQQTEAKVVITTMEK